MSILTETLPDSVIVDGCDVKINTDFKVWLNFSEMLNSNKLRTEDIVKIFTLIFPALPKTFNNGIEAILKFYSHSNKKTYENKSESTSNKNLFNFDYDADLIFSAFMQQYKIDLTTVNMHWWKFLALFGCLSEDTQFIKVIQYRGMDLNKIRDKEMLKHYKKMKQLYKLPDNRNEKQKEFDFNSSFVDAFI